ncbi:MAG TPA: site-specific integrase, partial [Sphingobacterium sp.]|nr:site-specific integrase [Sphingobacterium sp.]
VQILTMEKAIKVRLREQKNKSGRISLYLDFYPPIYDADKKKETRRKFINIYLYEKPKDRIEKEHNQVARMKAEQIRSEYELRLFNKSFGLVDRFAGKADFLAYFYEKVRKRYTSKGNYDNWLSTYNYLEAFTDGKCLFEDVDEKFCERFREYLKTTTTIKSKWAKLSQNSQHSYFNKFKAALKEAFEEKLFVENPARRVKGIPQDETHREFLTIEELRALRDTVCEHPVLKSAALFSALTGLRWSDIMKLTWADVFHSVVDGYYIRFTQQKTKGAEILPISEQAYCLLGEPQSAKERIFAGLKYSAYTNLILARWVMNAGIRKKITFHCFRHTYATLQLTMGTDIYTVSKLLGHRQLKTTEIYAKVIDKKKIEAASRIQL